MDRPFNKPRLLIIGHGRHGKDTVADIIEKEMGLNHSSSSVFVGITSVWDAWGKERYNTFAECFEDRVNFRSTWGDLIEAYNTPDKARTARTMAEYGRDMYVGMRRFREYEQCVIEQLYDHIIWVDASDRLPLEPLNSMNLQAKHADITIDNNGPEENLYPQILKIKGNLLRLGYNVDPNDRNPMKIMVYPE